MADGRRRAKRLLVLGAGPAQLGLLAAARERGLFVVAADRDASAPGFAFADRRALVSAEDEEAVDRLARAERVDGVIAPGIDWPVAIAARLAARARLVHPISPATAVVATNKLRQRARLAEARVPQPRWAAAAEPGDDVGFGFPCVVKPPDRQGQRGLSVVHEPEAMPAAVERARAASRSGACVVEELVDGPEVTVNAFVAGGRFQALTVTDRLTADPPAFGVALAHTWPSRLSGSEPQTPTGELRAGETAADPAETDSWWRRGGISGKEPLSREASVVETAGRAAEALGIRDGPVYVQLRVGPRGPRVIEVAARLGGGHDAELCRATVGADLNGAALAAALADPSLRLDDAEARGGGCVRFLVAPEGELRAVAGADEARAEVGVELVHLYRRPGHVFAPLRTGADRAGAILAVGASRDEALARADAAARSIRFEIADAEALV